ncbi:CPBP family intramembrane metalloprotease [Facklamia sp. DSM 111018]|uniref:CPBP family intramembrane metalloprotease n=1 Tax=Facklamia lactis TaxID=2749967 RepID=A0ABS0LQI9_9LACT|nr:type II CAAX endopeptidase family protein [Facklamia lactis]MBG9986222.1 CPBP family intramembrane metalloprotease [Facklamia lactis]
MEKLKNKSLVYLFRFLIIFMVGKPLMQFLVLFLSRYLVLDETSKYFNLLFLGSFIIFIILLYIVVKLEKRNLREFGINFIKDYKICFKYLILGIFLPLITLIFLSLCKVYDFKGFNKIDLKYIIASAIAYFIQGSSEELLIRGYLHNRIKEHSNYTIALILNTIFFTLPHILTIDNIFTLEVLVIIINLILISFIFTMINEGERRLLPSIGLHIGWNYSLGVICGTPISGIQPSSGLIKYGNIIENNIITGGNYGIEGSVLLIPILMLLLYLNFRRFDLKKGKLNDSI